MGDINDKVLFSLVQAALVLNADAAAAVAAFNVPPGLSSSVYPIKAHLVARLKGREKEREREREKLID